MFEKNTIFELVKSIQGLWQIHKKENNLKFDLPECIAVDIAFFLEMNKMYGIEITGEMILKCFNAITEDWDFEVLDEEDDVYTGIQDSVIGYMDKDYRNQRKYKNLK